MKTAIHLFASAALASLSLFGADAAAGKALFASKCQGCHGPTGQGNPAIAKGMKVTLRPLGSKEVQAKPDAELKKIITGGIGKMKPAVGVSDAQAGDIVAFTRTLK